VIESLQSKLSQLKEMGNIGKKKVEEKVFLQYGGQEVAIDDIMAKVKKEFIAEGHDGAEIKSIRLYLKPEENMVYYIINEESSSKVSLS